MTSSASLACFLGSSCPQLWILTLQALQLVPISSKDELNHKALGVLLSSQHKSFENSLPFLLSLLDFLLVFWYKLLETQSSPNGFHKHISTKPSITWVTLHDFFGGAQITPVRALGFNKCYFHAYTSGM